MALEDQVADALSNTAAQLHTDFQAAMVGTSPAAQAAHKAVMATSAGVASAARTESAALAQRENDAAEVARRGGKEQARMITREVSDRRAKLAADVATGTKLAQAQTHALEAVLVGSLVPPVAADNSARLLARSEIDGAANDISKLTALVGIDAATAAEVVTYGARRLRASAGADRELADANDLILRHSIVAKLSAQASTPEAKATVRALAALPKFIGSHSVVRQAAQLRGRTP